MQNRTFIGAADEKYAKRGNGETQHLYRNEFSRDRDRILYSKEFRRLAGKTQVFVNGYDDHVRTRLTHTLEVSQIAQTICDVLGLNMVLAEAIALGHDLGHTPFGHIGERTLNHFTNGCDVFKDFNDGLEPSKMGFKHNWQGLRVVTELEKMNPGHAGLNLTDYTLWGILHHSKLDWGECKKCIDGKCSLRHSNNLCPKHEPVYNVDFYNNLRNSFTDTSWTVEALIVAWADEIAQRHHDIEDGLEAKIIDKNELIQFFSDCFNGFLSETEQQTILGLRLEQDKTYYIPGFGSY
jgi:dGTPase